MRTQFKKVFLCFVLVVFFLFGSVSSVWSLSDKIYKDISTFSKVLDIVDKFYVENVKEQEIMVGAINGMLSSLDPHTVYMPPEDYKYFRSETKGRFGGVGIEVSVRDNVLTIISPLEGTPAWDAGIKSGDKILSIDGKTTKHMTLTDAVKLMRGSIGRKITLTIWREGKKGTRTITLVRRLIKIPSVKTEDLGKGFALFRIITFQEGVAKSLRKAIDDYKTKHKKIKGIIIDLRDNPGGLLTEAAHISDFFLKSGVIVSTKGRNKESAVKKAAAAGTYPNYPLIVMVNGGSASASEIVAGALQDHRRAKIIGTKSFGKGSVQTLINLDNGGAVKITVAHYFTPKNRLIDGKGISPDVSITTKSYLKKKKIKRKKGDPDQKISREEFYNYQKDIALKYLKKMARR